MSHLIWARTDDEALLMCQALASAIPHVGSGESFGPAQFAAVVGTGNKLKAIVAFHDYQPDYGTIQCSCASFSPMWARPHIIRELFGYVFGHLGCQKFWVSIPSDNEPAIKFNRSLGLTSEAVLRHHYGRKRHAVIMSLTDNEWKKHRYCNG